MTFVNAYSKFLAPYSDKLVSYMRSAAVTPEEAIDDIGYQFSSETDILYVEKYYDAETDAAIITICDNVKEGYRELISDATWLTEDTREGLLRKLDNIVYVTGSDAVRHGTEGYEDLSTTDYYHFMMDYQRLETREYIASLGKTADRKDIAMPMQIFNACYDPSLNNITITAAITNKPFFDKDADFYTNLGGIGSVIAHEIGHAFDSNCILFDEDGVYDPSWIDSSDVDKLQERNEQAVKYFEENFPVFENYARIWCIKQVDTRLFELLDYDTHSPEMIRTNAILATLDEFYETYDVKEGDGMYIAPDKRISRWH